MSNINNTPPTPRGTFPPSRTVFAPAPRTSPDHRFPGRPEGAVQAQALRELMLVVTDLERRLRALEGDCGNGALRMTLAHTTSGATEAEACQALALAVLHQAFLDATSPGGHISTRHPQDVESARAFLTHDGEWAASRRYWCDHAGLAPEWLERRIADLKAEGKL